MDSACLLRYLSHRHHKETDVVDHNRGDKSQHAGVINLRDFLLAIWCWVKMLKQEQRQAVGDKETTKR